MQISSIIDIVDGRLLNHPSISFIYSIKTNPRKVREGDLFIVKAREYPWYLNTQVYIKGSPESKEKRVLLEFTKSANPLTKSQLIVEEKRGVYTKEFSTLVKDFYLHL